jgi:hypothetical protein
VLGGIAAIVAARRRKTTKFEDSIISGTDIKTNTVFGSTGGGVVNTGENSLATDFSREGLGSIDTDEVDPIAEAEVYLAYGRDAQAEEIQGRAEEGSPAPGICPAGNPRAAHRRRPSKRSPASYSVSRAGRNLAKGQGYRQLDEHRCWR